MVRTPSHGEGLGTAPAHLDKNFAMFTCAVHSNALFQGSDA